jgi:hypothetical protein
VFVVRTIGEPINIQYGKKNRVDLRIFGYLTMMVVGLKDSVKSMDD